jgi:hypothetical protein
MSVPQLAERMAKTETAQGCINSIPTRSVDAVQQS